MGTKAAGERSIAAPSLMTPREAEVLPLLQRGRSNAQIALALHVGVETVRTHARNIYRKLGVSSRRELAAPAPASAPAPSATPAPSRTGQPESPAPRSARRRASTRMARPRRGPSLRHR